MSLRFPPRLGAALRGRVRAHALLLRADMSPRECVLRVAPMVGPDDRLLATTQGRLIVQFAAPRALRAELTCGELLSEQHGYLCSFPLDRDEAGGLECARGALLWWSGGALQTARRDELVPCAPEQWLDLGEVELVEVETIVDAPRAIPALVPTPPIDLRKELGVEEPSELERLEQARIMQSAQRSARPALWRRALAWLRARGHGGSERDHAPRSSPSTSSSWLGRLGSLLASALTRAGLAWVWLRPHGRYLRQLDRLFSAGNTLEALRRALPLGGDGGSQPKPLALLPPGRRADLSLAAPHEATHVLPLDQEWQAHLRRLYERAFQELERKGDIDHAAYVLAVLLGDVARAIQWLERHGRWQAAARLAESRNTPVSERVRLWFLAGELQRAVDLAAKYGAFADAVARLERRDPAQGQALRLRWADRSASAGHYLEAARIAWSIAEAKTLVDAWLARATADEGALAATAWVARIAWDPAQGGEARAPLVQLLDADDSEAPGTRNLLAQELLRHPRNQALDALSAPLARSLLLDRARGLNSLSEPQLTQLLERVPVLRADMPALTAASRSTVRLPTLRRVDVPMHERGALAVERAVAVPGGRTLVALGDLGVRLLARDGRVIARWEKEPAHRLIPSLGSHVITLSSRSNVKRLSRLDLATRRQERWFDLELESFASSFDGSTWYVVPSADRPRVVCLDALDAEPRVLWQVEVNGSAIRWRIDEKLLEFATFAEDQVELWSYELPSATLRARFSLVLAQPGVSVLAGEGRLVQWLTDGSESLQLWQSGKPLWTRQLPASITRPSEPGAAPPTLAVHWPWLCIAHGHAWGFSVDVIDLEHWGHWHALHLHGTRRLNAQLHANQLVLSDDLGRIVRVDLERGSHTLLRG